MKTQHTRAIRLAIVAASAIAVAAIILVFGGTEADQPQLAEGGSWTYAGESGAWLNSAFVSIPEPGAWVSLIGGGAVLMGIQRFRRRA